MWRFLLWIYIINLILLIIHEIESAYWKEWELFRLPGGLTGFLLFHFPFLFLGLYGLIRVYDQKFSGLIFSLLIGICGLGAFCIHTYFRKKGHDKFGLPVSFFILWSLLLVSFIQLGITVFLLII